MNPNHLRHLFTVKTNRRWFTKKLFKDMDWKVVCEIGVKILATVAAGAIVYTGISKSISAGKKEKNSPDPNTNTNGNGFNPVSPPPQVPLQQQEESKILSSMKAAQSTFGKVFAFIQSLTQVTENLSDIFDGNKAYRNSQPYYQNSWSYRQPIDVGNGQQWTRISPFIIEAGPVNPGNNYCC